MGRVHQLLNVEEAAKRLGLSVFTLRTWISQRRVEVVRLGRRVFIKEDFIENLIENCTVEPRSGRGAGE